MKITKPEDLSVDSAIVEDLIAEFEMELSKVIPGCNYYSVKIYSREKRMQVLEKIQEAYLAAGWGRAVCYAHDHSDAIDLDLYRHSN